MNNLSYFHGRISVHETELRLRQLELVGSFLMRLGGTNDNVIVSYLNEKIELEHKILPCKSTSELIRHHQEGGASPESVFTFLQTLDTIWIHPVDRGEQVSNHDMLYFFICSTAADERWAGWGWGAGGWSWSETDL